LKEANLDVEFFYTEGGGQTLQVINSGSGRRGHVDGLLARSASSPKASDSVIFGADDRCA
jgi:hypothetical protein